MYKRIIALGIPINEPQGGIMKALSNQLVFSISGLRCAGRTKLYDELNEILPELYPDHEFAFLGNPFGSLEHPCYWDSGKRDILPSSRILICWAPLNEFVGKKLLPALEAGKIVITDGFGLDGFLHSLAHCHDAYEYDQTSRLHHDLVKSRLARQKIEPPRYLLVSDSIETIAKRIHRSKKTTAFMIEQEEEGIRRYFDGTGQKQPHFLNGYSTEERLNEALIILNEYL